MLQSEMFTSVNGEIVRAYRNLLHSGKAKGCDNAQYNLVVMKWFILKRFRKG